MLDVNEALRERYGLFSREGLLATVIQPQTYLATSVYDFLENRSSIHPTSWSPIKIKKKMHYAALVGIENCYYRSIKDPEESKRMSASFVRTIDFLINVPTMKPLINELFKNASFFLANGCLYDRQNEERYVPIVCAEPPSNGTKIFLAGLQYFPRESLAVTLFLETTSSSPRQSHKKRSPFYDLIALLPELNPA